MSAEGLTQQRLRSPPLAPTDDNRLVPLLEEQQGLLDLIFRGESLEVVAEELADLGRRLFGAAVCIVRLQGVSASMVGTGAAAEQAVVKAAVLADKALVSILQTAVNTRTRQVLSDPKCAAAAEWMLSRFGIACGYAEPVGISGADCYGAVGIYYQERMDVDQHALMETFCGLVGFTASAWRREFAAREAHDRYAMLVSTIPGVVYQRLVTPTGDIRYTYISEGARELFGVSPDEIVADPAALFQCHGPDYKARFRERLIEASKSLSLWDVEASLVTRDGRKKYTHAIARPALQPDGAVLWTGVILDETRTREAIMDSLSQGLLLYDAQDRIVMRNSHYLTLYPSLKDIAVPGASYAEVIAAELAGSAHGIEEATRSAAFNERMSRHGSRQNVLEQQLEGDNWVLISEQKTADGGTLVLYTDITELKSREKQIYHLAYHDALTGLPNRMLFGQRLAEAIVRAEASGRMLGVMCLDVDHFKNVNDTLGHAAGDALLREIADRLKSILGDSRTVARLGGDEFGIIISNCDRPERLSELANRILLSLSEPVNCNGHRIVSGLSIGVALSPSDAREPDQLLKNADLALYRAKGDGRGTFRFFEAEMDARAQNRRALEQHLRAALNEQQLELHYQPQVALETNALVGFEALVRWRHPERGLVPPSEFITLAEETGIIVPLGEWVMRQACQDAAHWPSSIRVAVNVSPMQFRNRDLPEVVARVMADTDFDPARLELEITESLLLHDLDATVAALEILKALGVNISMDDFGTGYSSLGNLRSFSFDKIKIDQHFVKDLETNSDSAAIVSAVLALGYSLRIATCAEGVETLQQLNSLRAQNCTHAQGFYFSRPLPAAEVPAFIRNFERSQGRNNPLQPSQIGEWDGTALSSRLE